ncbi:hypothetical protein BDW75DRAFT_148836 [Aspergillus navahoensis]
MILKYLESKVTLLEFQEELKKHLEDLQSRDADCKHPYAGVDSSQHQEPTTPGTRPKGKEVSADITLFARTFREESLVATRRSATDMVQVHIGRFASADTVVRSEKFRDELGAKYNIIGYEMEAPGVWDYTTPCLVIKGINDYADAHKDDLWKNYAAATGASAAKAFLKEYWKPASEFGKNHWTVPFPRNQDFVGRKDEIEQLQSQILSQEGPKTIAMFGLGGIGKTDLAVELAYRMRDKDREYSFFWISCANMASIEQGFVNISAALGTEKASPAETREYVKTRLSCTVTKWLLLLDNVDSLDLWKFLRGNLPQNEDGRILVTTRSRIVAIEAAPSHIVRISEPDYESAIGILHSKMKDEARLVDKELTIAFLKRLPRLPLAIVQAASYLRRNENITILKYLELFDKEESDAVALLSTDFDDEGRYTHTPNPVSTTWLVSFRQISDINQLAASYLKLMACLSHHEIPHSFLPQPTSEKAKLEAVGDLMNFSFVTAASTRDGTGPLTMHRLVRLATRNWMRQNQQFADNLRDAADRVEEILPKVGERSLHLRHEYLPHATFLLKEKEIHREDHFALICKAAYCLSNASRYKEALELYLNALELQEMWFGNRDPSTLLLMGDVATAYRNAGQLGKAEEVATRALEISKEVLGEEHADTVFTMTNLAAIYKLQGRWAEGEALILQAVGVQKRTAPDHPDTLGYMSIAGISYALLRRTKDAEDIISQVLKAREETLGPGHLDTLDSMTSMALITRSNSQLKKGKESFTKLIEEAKRDELFDYPRLIVIGTRLASISLILQQPKQAEELATQSLEIAAEVLGAKHRHTSLAKLTLAEICSSQGRLQEAEDLMLRVLEELKEVSESDSIRIIQTMFALRNMYERQGQQSGVDRMEQAIKARLKEDAMATKDSQVLDIIYAAAQSFNDTGAREQARRTMDVAVRLAREVLGPSDPKTKSYIASLSQLEEETVRVSTAVRPGSLSRPVTSRRRDRPTLRSFLERAQKAMKSSGRSAKPV